MRMRIVIVPCVLALCAVAAPAVAQPVIRSEAPTDRAADLSAQTLAYEIDRMEAEGISTVRLLEGGTHNVNIRHDENITPENSRILVHPDFVDIWVVQRGSGVLATGGELVDGEHVGGVERVIGEGDAIFIPNGVPHGIKEAKSITWLNVRYIFENE
ncbi:MAG: hypothetical protein GEU90_10180 [Gemmatimonas sp.]|nr:hypothetical protein [Gemmatimonas sp.]